MDFVDLDKVLDEFEEEEKAALSIVPGHELKPSGYIEFLQKHKDHEWASLNSELSSSSGYSLEPQSIREPVNISYDDPYEGFTHSKLGFIQESRVDTLSHNGHDVSPVGKLGNSGSELVTNLTSMGGTDGSKNVIKRGSSGHKGTIAARCTEVQTDQLSPASEQELMSSPFPRTDIIVDGHGDTSVSNNESNEQKGEHNHSPIYASVDSEAMGESREMGGPHESCQPMSLVNGHQTISVGNPPSSNPSRHSANTSTEIGPTSDSANNSGGQVFAVCKQSVGFHDPVDEDLDDTELNSYLNQLDGGGVDEFSSSKTPTCGFHSLNSASTVDSEPSSAVLPDIHGTLNCQIGHAPQSIADELKKAELGKDHSQDPDLVVDLGTNLLQGNLSRTCELVEERRGEFLGSCGNREAIYNSLASGKTEIEDILDGKISGEKKTEGCVSKNIGNMEEEDHLVNKDMFKISETSVEQMLLRGKMEVEGVLDEVVQNQQNTKHDHSWKVPEVNNGVNQPDVTQKYQIVPDSELQKGKATEASPLQEELMSCSPAQLSPGTADVSGSPTQGLGIGARPKDPSVIKKIRPNSLVGLSKVNLDLHSSAKSQDVDSVVEQLDSNQKITASSFEPEHPHTDTNSKDLASEWDGIRFVTGLSPHSVAEQNQRLHSNCGDNVSKPNENRHSETMSNGAVWSSEAVDSVAADDSYPDHCLEDENSEAGAVQRLKRPTTLNLPSRPDFSKNHLPDGQEEHLDQGEEGSSPSLAAACDVSNTEEELGEEDPHGVSLGAQEESGQGEGAVTHPDTPVIQSDIGNVAPFWIPDAEAPVCMICETKFTMWKRRHHCRACGKVLCSTCCSQKALLLYMDNKEARVCVDCHDCLSLAHSTGSTPRSPNPNNPNEYCSKVPPTQQASNHGNIPVVMVPTGVLKTSGSLRRSGEPKQVMFSDGIRPGGDLTELDGPKQSRSQRRSARSSRRAAAQEANQAPGRKDREESCLRSACLVPEHGLPPLYIPQGETGFVETDEMLNQIDYTADYKAETGPAVNYAVNKNLSVAVRIINLDCCVNRVCWSFVSRGMVSAGQSEIIILLELTEDEVTSEVLTPPRDIFVHFQYVYEEALKGNIVQDMGHSVSSQEFLGSREFGGFLYLQPTFQCLNKLNLPEAPYLFAVLLQKWEAPWAKVFPIRLMLRLGAEYRYYPCPLVGVRDRKSVFYEIGHTIINLLADFRNYQYMLTQIRGVSIHMENKKTIISFPRNRYDDVMKVVRSSNEHVMALASSFSSQADSHLVCIQNEDGNYQTQAINIQNKPRLVTGASFVVFSGALKSSSGLRAKSSIVEDGLMVQVLPEAMASLKESLKDMSDHIIHCGPVDTAEPEELVQLQWVDNDRNFNLGVKSYIDEMSLEGVESVSVKSPQAILGETLAIRWTRVYFLQHEDSGSSHVDPRDLSRLTEDIAMACSTGLLSHLEELRTGNNIKLGLRVKLTRDSVGYEAGSRGQSLPPAMLNSLDSFLIPIIHQASEEGIVMELIFNVVEW